MPLDFAARDAIGPVLAVGLPLGHRNVVAAASFDCPTLAVASIEVPATCTERGTDCGRCDIAGDRATDERPRHSASDLRVALHGPADISKVLTRGQSEHHGAERRYLSRLERSHFPPPSWIAAKLRTTADLLQTTYIRALPLA